VSVEIRPLSTLEEFRACEDLQRRTWRMPDDLDVVPLHFLLSAQRCGAVVLGAFDGDVLAGFVFGYPGFGPEGKLKHCSHMMGVAPEYQSEGVGYELKLAQREVALAQGFDLMTWTYDPLESRNANLNIRKLGAVCRTYIPDFYGPMADGLNVGLPSDRFQVDWWIASSRAKPRAAWASVRGAHSEELGTRWTGSTVLANAVGCSGEGPVTPGAMILDAAVPAVQVEIPADYQAIKSQDPELALEWRLATRRVFQFYFDAGFEVVDFVSQPVERGRRSSYLLTNRLQE